MSCKVSREMISSTNQPAGSPTIASGETSWARLRQFLIANHSSIVAREVTNENAVHLYSLGNWWLAFDRSAFQLSDIFPDAGTTALNFQDSPSPVLMISVSDDSLSKIVGNHSARAISPEHIVLHIKKLNSGEYRLWRSLKLGEMDVNCHF